MKDAKKLKESIEIQQNSLKTERLDMTFGELMNMYEEGNLIITPEYQRVFRWDRQQQTRFIESILLGIPIPPIFVAVDDEGKWELVDGLQRISTFFSFFGLLNNYPEKNNLVLTPGDIVESLEGYSIEDLPMLQKISLKRSICRIEVIKWDSSVDMRFQLFNRLNRGSMPLTEQEIRNCIFRGFNTELNQTLIEIGESTDFLEIVKPTEKQSEEMYTEELILRFFTFKHAGMSYKSSIQDHFTKFMKEVSKNKLKINIKKEKQNLKKIIEYIKTHYTYKLFRASNGVFSPFYFDVIMLGLDQYYNQYKNAPDEFQKKIQSVKNNTKIKTIQNNYFGKDKLKLMVSHAMQIIKRK